MFRVIFKLQGNFRMSLIRDGLLLGYQENTFLKKYKYRAPELYSVVVKNQQQHKYGARARCSLDTLYRQRVYMQQFYLKNSEYADFF